MLLTAVEPDPGAPVRGISPPAGLPRSPHTAPEPLSTVNTSATHPRPATILSLDGALMLRFGLALSAAPIPPALFAAELFQLRRRRRGQEVELNHVADCDSAVEALCALAIAELYAERNHWGRRLAEVDPIHREVGLGGGHREVVKSAHPVENGAEPPL